jgi:hypothetical protein
MRQNPLVRFCKLFNHNTCLKEQLLQNFGPHFFMLRAPQFSVLPLFEGISCIKTEMYLATPKVPQV